MSNIRPPASTAVRVAVMATLGVVTLGCGSGEVSFTGSVKLDGSPIADAFVSLTPAEGGRPVSATTDAAGVFRFGEGASPALPAGEYNVTVTKVEAPQGGEVDGDGIIPVNVDPRALTERWLTPPRYAKASTSGLSTTVERGMNEIELDLLSQ